MVVEIKEASAAQMPIIINMGKLYRYDLSEFTQWEIEADGMHRCYGFERYWCAGYYPFMVYVDAEIAGFALLSREDETYEIDEFFILRKFRRRGVARQSARLIFEKFKGKWLIQQLSCNSLAITFWKNLISEVSKREYESYETVHKEHGAIHVLRFSNEETR